jgi:hypothetical protein
MRRLRDWGLENWRLEIADCGLRIVDYGNSSLWLIAYGFVKSCYIVP